MSARTYKQRTKVLGIPVHGYKDGIYPEVEIRKWQLVENILLAATRSFRNCVFEEGVWSSHQERDGSYTVTLSTDIAAGLPAICGVVKGAYFIAPHTLKWTGVPAGLSYLYITVNRNTVHNPQSFRVYTRNRKAGMKHEMLVAVFDSRTGKIEKNPEGKVYASTLTAPGDMLSPVVVDFESEGQDGFVINTKRKISFIQVSKIHTGSFDKPVGEIAVGYYGKDEAVAESTQAIVYNSGDQGIPLRAIVFCG